MINDAQFLDWLADSGAQRVTLFEVGVKSAGVDITRYLSTKAYIASASTPYLAVVAGGLKVTESISLDSSATLSAGDIEIHNADGSRDAWLDDIWVNQPVNAFVGDVRWDRADFRQVFSGVVVDIGCKSRDRLNLRLVNKLERLNTPVTDVKIGGNAANPDALAPVLLGECHNISPVPTNPNTLEYAFGDGANEAIAEVRTEGKPRGAVAVTAGTGRLVFTEAVGPGVVTCDAQGTKFNGSYVNTIGQLVQYLVTQRGKSTTRFTAADLDAAQLATFEAANPQPVGLYLTERTNVLVACQQLASSVGAQLVLSMTGKLRLIQFVIPASATAEIRPGTLNSDVTLGSLGFTGDKYANYTSPSKGAALNDDPGIENQAAWTMDSNVSIAHGAGAVGGSWLYCSAGLDQRAVSRRWFSIDRARTYSLTAMLYATVGNNRNMYLFVNFYDALSNKLQASPGWGGAMSGYTFGGLPPAGDWSRQGSNFGAGTSRSIPAGTVWAEVGIWFQYSSGGGSGSVSQAAQDIRLEDVTAAVAAKAAADAAAQAAVNAQSDATAAMGRITSISSDSKLDRSEKADTERAWSAIDAEYAGLVSQSGSLGVTYSDWENRYYELRNYLTSITGWGNHSTDSDIDRNIYNLRWNNYYSARQALLNAFAAKAATTATWAGTSGRPSDDAIRNNMLDLSWWKRDAVLPWQKNDEYNRIVTCGVGGGADVNVAGPRGGSDLVWYASESGNGASGGGWTSVPVALDPNKTYRFVVPIYRLSGTGSAYWGTGSVCALNTQTQADNPYFAYSAGLAVGRWYLFVGYIYPAGSTGNTHESAGIWDCSTGAKIVDGSNYCSIPGNNTVVIRAYQYYASPNAEQVFGRPMVNLVDGTEPSLREYFAASAMLNSQQQWGDVKGAGRPADNATVGAVIGQNLSGQFTQANVSTYIQGAAIGLAQINTASIGNLSALTANVGLLRTATWGGRMEIENNQLRVYDDSNNFAVMLGRLDP